MKMKISKQLLGGLVGILLMSCSLPKDPSVTINYAGEFYAFMLNENEGISKLYVDSGEGSKTWSKYDLEPIFGELKNLRVDGRKILNTGGSNDYGNLTVIIDDGNAIVAEDTAEKGTNDACAEYSF